VANPDEGLEKSAMLLLSLGEDQGALLQAWTAF